MASRACLTSFLQEKAAFFAYHSFESTGCALVLHTLNGVQVGAGVRHEIKIQHFIRAATVYRIDATISALESNIGSLRNLLLYPRISRRSVTLPENQITLQDAEDIVDDINSIVQIIESIIS